MRQQLEQRLVRQLQEQLVLQQQELLELRQQERQQQVLVFRPLLE